MESRYVFFFLILVSIPLRAQKTNGVLADTIKCYRTSDYSYALYTPALSNDRKPIGLLFFFDPGGRAALPLKLYSEIADKYALILACSYQSRNGPNQSPSNAALAVIEDLRSKVEINQIWLSGFSGGARAASFMATQFSGFSGIIACGAAFHPNGKITGNHAIPFSEIVGITDMNYLEAIEASEYLAGIKNPSILIPFSGGHQWPPSASFEMAVQWQLLNQDKLPAEQRSAFFDHLYQAAKTQLDSGYVYPAWLSIERPIPNASVEETGKTDSIKTLLTSSHDFNSNKASFTKALDAEAKMMDDFFNRFYDMMAKAGVDSLFDRSEWVAQRKGVDKLIRSDDHYQSLSGKRVYDFCWRRCIEQYYTYIALETYDKALQAAKIWNAFDPDKPDPLVLLAQAYALKGENRKSIQYLQLAVKKGFTEKEYLLNEPAFKSLYSSKAFQKLLDQLH